MSSIRQAIRDAIREMEKDRGYERTAYFGTPRNPIMVYPSEYRWLKQHGVDVSGFEIIKLVPTRRMAMKIFFQYQDESPFLMPGYSRYYEVIEAGEKHIGMIHLAHRDWQGVWSHDDGKTFDKKMPHKVEITIAAWPASKGHISRKEEDNAISNVRSGKGVAARPAEKSETRKASARTRESDDKMAPRPRKSITSSVNLRQTSRSKKKR